MIFSPAHKNGPTRTIAFALMLPYLRLEQLMPESGEIRQLVCAKAPAVARSKVTPLMTISPTKMFLFANIYHDLVRI